MKLYLMASLRKEVDRNRSGWRLQFRQSGKRRSLWLGSISKRAAETVMRHVDELARAEAANTTPDAESAKWANGLDGRIRETLERWGLVEAAPNRNTDADRFLGAFCERYIKGRTDVSQATRDKYGHTKRFLVGKFGEDRMLKTITKSDAKAWQRWLMEQPGSKGKTMAESTASKHVKRAKTMFDDAVDARLIPESPMDAIKGGDEVNRDRDFFITPEAAARVLNACPDAEWRLIFALARFGGLRVCEILTVTLDDIQWSESRLRIDSPKTGLRFAPIFPELLPHLEAVFNAAPGGQVRCLERYAVNANLGTTANRIIERAGLVPWEKTFQNLRATRRTELQERFADHVVNGWLGQSSRVALKSYLQITPDHWTAGATETTANVTATNGGVLGGVIPAHSQAFGANSDAQRYRKGNKKASESLGNTEAAPPAGLEPATRRLTAACSTN